MQGPIFQSVSLTLWGNATLLPHGISTPATGTPATGFSVLGANHSTVRACDTVRFVTLHPGPTGWEEQPYAATPGHWLAALLADGVTRLRLHHIDTIAPGDPGAPDLGAVGIPGDRWLIEAVQPDGSDIWQARWHSAPRKNGDRSDDTDGADFPSEGTAQDISLLSCVKPDDTSSLGSPLWSVTYGRIASGFRPPPADLIDPDRLSDALVETLESVLSLARHHGLTDLTGAFDLALRKLTSLTPEAGLPYPDLFPPAALTRSHSTTLQARQFLACAQTAIGVARPDPIPTMTAEEQQTWGKALTTVRQHLISAILYAANLDPLPPPPSPLPSRWQRWWPFG